MKKLIYSTKRVPIRLKTVMCTHCKQITMFEDCLNELPYYDHFVCWDCLKRLYLSCEGCGSWYLEKSSELTGLHEYYHNHNKSGKVCDGCVRIGDYNCCDDCGEIYIEDACKFYDSLDRHVCKECLREKYNTCTYCDDYYRNDELLTDVNGNNRCEGCSEYVEICSHCEVFGAFDEITDVHGVFYCERCFSEIFRFCDFCGEVFDVDEVCRYEGNIYCIGCGADRDLPIHNVGGKLIRDYMFKPPPKFYRLAGDDKLHFGVELEVENVKEGISNEKMIEKLLPVFKNLAYYKRDSSINHGFELVTHPFTWRWYKENRKMWEEGLKLLRDEGFESYKPGTCGIHVHMSKKAFSDVHLFKFLKLYYENFQFIYKISQRDEKSTSGSCQWGRSKKDWDQKVVLDRAKKKRGFDRYTRVNMENRDTYEVRVFRGTLKTSSFLKNIEFCKAVYEFTNVTGITSISVEEFKKFVGQERKSYGNLWEFMGEKEV